MTWKIQAITGELTGQEISIDRDMLVGRHDLSLYVLIYDNTENILYHFTFPQR
jgi:hypothetical protein